MESNKEFKAILSKVVRLTGQKFYPTLFHTKLLDKVFFDKDHYYKEGFQRSQHSWHYLYKNSIELIVLNICCIYDIDKNSCSIVNIYKSISKIKGIDNPTVKEIQIYHKAFNKGLYHKTDNISEERRKFNNENTKILNESILKLLLGEYFKTLEKFRQNRNKYLAHLDCKKLGIMLNYDEINKLVLHTEKLLTDTDCMLTSLIHKTTTSMSLDHQTFERDIEYFFECLAIGERVKKEERDELNKRWE